MKERTSSTIDIQRQQKVNNRRVWRTIATVPITESCLRKFTLMSEDCIVLSFDMADPIPFVAGDRIVDEVFGTFRLKKAQLPTYNVNTGGYHYELQFDAPYVTLDNKLFMLTAVGDDDIRTRKEATWTLTGNLASHLDELVNNLNVLGYSYNTTIHENATHAKEVKSLSYSGISIINALNQLANTFECEWWFKNDAFHFGKCEDNADAMDFEIGENCLNIIPKDSRSTYSNRVYIYGSKDNIPLTYRKKLYIKATSTATSGIQYFVMDKKLTRDMFGKIEPLSTSMSLVFKSGEYSSSDNSFTFVTPIKSVNIEVADAYKVIGKAITLSPSSYAAIQGYTGYVTISAKITLSNNGNTVVLSEKTIEQRVSTEVNIPIFYPDDITLDAYSHDINLQMGAVSLQVEYKLKCNASTPPLRNVAKPTAVDYNTDVSITSEKRGVRGIIQAKYDGTTYYLMLNSLAKNQYEGNVEQPLYYAASFCDNQGTIQAFPTGFTTGSILEVVDDNATLVPSAFYATSYDDPTALARIGEMRLQLPLTDVDGNVLYGYLDVEDAPESVLSDEKFESIVYFEDIYPDAKLVIDSITTEKKTDYTKYEGETTTNDWQFEEYTLKLKLANGDDFKFQQDYMLPNTTLQIRFITPDDMGWEASDYADQCKLMGMTYEAHFNADTNTFTVVRNEDFGTLLPNSVLYPSVGDPCVLIGWNVKNLTNMGLIDNAEARLLAKGKEYVDALKEGEFTFDCTMMFDFMFDLIEYLQLSTNEDEEFVDNSGAYVLVKNAHDDYAIPIEGAKVTIKHQALQADKTSRIIGYEFKLDKPYDAPKYVVGETQAYSKLAQIEREITKISNN